MITPSLIRNTPAVLNERFRTLGTASREIITVDELGRW